MSLKNLIKQRASVRAFLDRPGDRALVEVILEEARWSPSGSNLQPWKVIAVSGVAPINSFRPDQSSVSEFACFYGFAHKNSLESETDCSDVSNHA